MDIKYEKVLDYCFFFSCNRHFISNCKRKDQSHGKDEDHVHKIAESIYVPTGKKTTPDDDNKIVLEPTIQVDVVIDPNLDTT